MVKDMARQVKTDPEHKAAWLRLRALRTLADTGWVRYLGVLNGDAHVVQLPGGGHRYLGRNPGSRQYEREWQTTAWWWAVGFADRHGAGQSILDLDTEPVPDMLYLPDVADMIGMTVNQILNAWRADDWPYYRLWLWHTKRHVFRAQVEAHTATWGLENGVLHTRDDMVGYRELQRIWDDIAARIPQVPAEPAPATPGTSSALDRHAIAAERRQESLDVALDHGVITAAAGGGHRYQVRIPRPRGEVVRELTGDAVQPWVLGAMDAAGMGALATYRLGL